MTLSVNGYRKDHHWRRYHIFFGSSLDRGKLYGNPPEMRFGTEADIGFERLFSTIALQQIASTHAKWFDAKDSEMAGLFVPDIGNCCSTTYPGVMKS